MSESSEKKQVKIEKSRWKILIRAVIIVLLFPLFLSFLIQVPFIQKMAINYLTDKIEKKIDKDIKITKVYINPFKGLEMESSNIHDKMSGDTLLQVDKLTISLAKNLFSLFNSELGLKSIEVDGTRINAVKEKGDHKNQLTILLEKLSSSDSKKESSRDPIKLAVEQIVVKNIEYTLLDKNSNSTSRYVLDEGVIEFNKLDFQAGIVDIEIFSTQNPYVEIIKRGEGLKDSTTILTEGMKDTDAIVFDTTTAKGRLTISQFDIVNGTFIYRDETNVKKNIQERSLDYSDFRLEEIAFSIDSFNYDPSWEITADLKNIRFKDDKGFELTNLSSDEIVISDTEVSFPSMVFETKQSRIESELSFLFEELSDFESFSKNVYLRSDIRNSKIAFDDLLHFVSSLNNSEFFVHNKDKVVSLSGNFRGVVDNLSGRNVRMRLTNKLNFEGNFGTINFTDTDNALVNLKINQLNTSIPFLRKFIPGFNPPDNFSKLGNFSFYGRYDGYFRDFVAAGRLNTDLGSAGLDMNLDVKEGNDKAKYSGEMRLIDFDLGAWSENDKIEKVTFYAQVNEGEGLTLNSAVADLEANVESLVYKGYAYKDFAMDGKVQQNSFKGLFNITDENINLSFNGDISYQDSLLELNVDADVKELNLQKLNFTDNYRNLEGSLKANVKGTGIADLTGDIKARDISIEADSFSQHFDTLFIFANNIPGEESRLEVYSDFAQVELDGQYNLTDIIPQIKYILKKNYPYHTRSWEVDEKVFGDNNFVVNINLDDATTIFQLAGIEDLNIRNLRAKGNVDSSRDNFNLDTYIEFIEYKSNKLYNTDLVLGNRSDKGFLVLNVDSSEIGDRIWNPFFIETDLDKDSIAFQISTADLFDSLQMVDIRGSLKPHEKGYTINVKDNDWEMLGKKWSFYSGNEVIIGNKYLDIRDLIISDGYREIEIQDVNNNGITVHLKRFDFLLINGIIDYDKIDFSGELDVKARIGNLYTGKTYYQASAYIDDFRLNEERYGVLDLSFDRAADDSYKALISIAKGEQTVKANFVYDAEKDYVNGSVRARSFPLDIFEFIIQSGISETTGTGDVDAEIYGPPDDLKLSGEGSFKNGGVKIDYLGTSFYFHDQVITIDEKYLDLTGGIITDIEGNQGTMTGGLIHDLFRDFRLDVTMRSDRAVLIKTTKADNPIYYGYGRGQVEAAFSGTFSSANMKIKATTGPGTELNIPVEYTEVGYDQSFIKFVKKEELLAPKDIDVNEEFKIEGLNVEMELTLTDDADIKIIFNERLGDIIQGSGRGFLQIYARRTGEFEIFGDYEVERGEYLFTAWGVVAKPFIVRKGGRIKWTGDPINAALDIKADYQVRAPLTLFLDEFLQTAENDVQIEARTKQDIDLTLLLGGTLYTPLVKFDIDFPSLTGELNNYAQSKLRSLRTNEIALNSQVLGLIVFNSFLPTVNNSELNFSNEAVVTATNTLSEFVSSQLSLYLTGLLQEALSENGLIADIDFEIGLRKNSTFYNPDETTDLYPDEIEVHLNNRFRFLDERLSLGAGFNYVADSPYGVSNYYVPDFVIEYYLTNDRQLKLRMYGRYDYDQVEIARRQRYGLGIGYRKEFGSLTDFFDDLKKSAKSAATIEGGN